MDCCTKKVGWTVIQRRLDRLLYKEGWMEWYTKKVGWTVLQRSWLDSFTKKVGWTDIQRSMNGLFHND